MIQLNEVALSKADAMERCYSLGIKFIEHFHKIYTNPSNPSINHWESEMQGWLNIVRRLRLKTTNNLLLNRQITDWFFTVGALPEDIVDMDEDEQVVYDKFCTLLLSNLSVKESIEEVLYK